MPLGRCNGYHAVTAKGSWETDRQNSIESVVERELGQGEQKRGWKRKQVGASSKEGDLMRNEDIENPLGVGGDTQMSSREI